MYNDYMFEPDPDDFSFVGVLVALLLMVACAGVTIAVIELAR